MFAELLLDVIFDLIINGAIKMVAAIVYVLIQAVRVLGRVAHLSQSSISTECRVTDYVDSLLFDDEHLQPRQGLLWF